MSYSLIKTWYVHLSRQFRISFKNLQLKNFLHVFCKIDELLLFLTFTLTQCKTLARLVCMNRIAFFVKSNSGSFNKKTIILVGQLSVRSLTLDKCAVEYFTSLSFQYKNMT